MHEYWEGYRAGRLHALFVGVCAAQNYQLYDELDEIAGSDSSKTYKVGYNKGIASIIDQYKSENAKKSRK